uniref:Uncharacterized protein n=1 Tax=Rhizophora mucronata TaxID=61149 RepID=A0A2P2NNS1_RHIMU
MPHGVVEEMRAARERRGTGRKALDKDVGGKKGGGSGDGDPSLLKRRPL